MNNCHLRLPQGISYSELCLGELQARPSHIYSASSLLMAVFPDVAALPDSVDSAHGHGPIPSQAHANTDLICIRNWRDGSVVASCSSRGPGSNSQYPQNESQVSVTPVTWDSLPSFSLLGHCAHVAHRHTHADITPTHITYNKFCKRSREEAKEWS